jgi:hypothetical protein
MTENIATPVSAQAPAMVMKPRQAASAGWGPPTKRDVG